MKESSKDFLERLKSLGPMPSEDQRRKEVAQNYVDMAPVLKDLADHGFVYDSINSLRHSGIVYRAAIPILLKWLPEIQNYDIGQTETRKLGDGNSGTDGKLGDETRGNSGTDGTFPDGNSGTDGTFPDSLGRWRDLPVSQWLM